MLKRLCGSYLAFMEGMAMWVRKKMFRALLVLLAMAALLQFAQIAGHVGAIPSWVHIALAGFLLVFYIVPLIYFVVFKG
ncbi:hypothetical protein [Poseidonocella sp. HB161398]|uniref:hypothetical protein n=1 Tax=Poseidonocella sp. HB161398 TaxID=2320855 RepID=UPI001107BC76|nr:hypothetical protein [Poseidonocella sp. HB161398]